ncbi:MAG TPA: response regulator transcription factor [Dehalococcoidia bacterium]|nr:response regulator transcription factor [Dehalococcoidia bacterium]
MAREPIRVLVVASYPAVRAGLRAMLDGAEGIVVVGDSPRLSLRASEVDRPDVVLVELDSDSDSILESLEDAAAEHPLVMLAGDPDAYQELTIGEGRPVAYLLRSADADDIVAAVHAVVRGLVVSDPSIGQRGPRSPAVAGDGVSPLTDRELDVLRLLALGLPNKGIALELGISEHTVKFHVGSILSRLNAGSRTEAVMLAARRGILPL